jgi:hypothetical protein
MTKEQQQLLELLKFGVNEKAKIASAMMQQQKPNTSKKYFYSGTFQAFSEIYSMLEGIERTL